MKRTLPFLLVALLIPAAYLAGSINASKTIELPAANWTGDSEAAIAWRELAASIEAAGARVFAATDNVDERIDGLNYLAQLSAASLEMKLSKGDRAAPQFTDWMRDYRKFLGDSPDAVYHTAEISSQYSYEVSGNIGDAEYLGFMLYGKSLNGWNRGAANISSEQLNFDEAGNFKIILSAKKPAEQGVDWLELEDDVHMVMVRQYFHGRSGKREAQLAIVNRNPSAYAQANDADVATAMREATTFFNETLDGAIALSGMLAGSPNDITPPKSYNADFGGVFYPTFDNQYFGSWFYLLEDEALVIEGEVPDAPYWAISLQNRWMQSMDYQNYVTALNDHEIKTQNGRYRVVVAHQDPGEDNWISTAGYREGLLSIRYQLASGNEAPTLTTVKFNQL